MSRFIAVLDAQFGSTGKGNVVGYVGQHDQPDTIVTAWAPNAGHTSIVNGVKFIHTQLANGIQSPRLKTVLIGPGSVVNLGALYAEVRHATEVLGSAFDMVIHPHAAVLLDEDSKSESEHLFKIGSTMKGSMAAVVRKMSRTDFEKGVISQAIAHNITVAELYSQLSLHLQHYGGSLIMDVHAYHEAIKNSEVLLAEGCQGFGLGINSGLYPYCTSRECTLSQLLTDCAIPMEEIEYRTWDIIGVARTFPIRVANRYDENGNQIGTSGPGWYDHEETTWEKIGVEPEITTVTKLERRVFTFSLAQVREAVRMSGMTSMFVTFADYISDAALETLVNSINDECGFDIVTHCAFGPNSMTDIRPWPGNRA